MNKAWHSANVLGRHASLSDRIAWHLEHQKRCGCRPIPKSVQEALKRGASARLPNG